MIPFHYRKYKLIQMMKSNSELFWPQSWGGNVQGHGYAPYLDYSGGFIDICRNLYIECLKRVAYCMSPTSLKVFVKKSASLP